MRIALTGGGTGGHFYPLIAVAEAIEEIARERRLIEPEIIYIGPKPFDEMALLEHDIRHLPGFAGKPKLGGRWGPVALLKTLIGVIQATLQLFRVYPDAVFSTGGYAAFPTLFAARILAIPVIIYDADATPGKVSLWSSRFARWIGVAHPDAALQFPEKVRAKIARVGHPIRKEVETPSPEGGFEFLKLPPGVPTLFVMGGSQGAVAINETLLDSLPDLISRYNVVHQTGAANLEEVRRLANVVLHETPHADERYRPFGLLNTLALKMTAGISSLVIARAGSGTIFELASWGIPSILIPIPEDVSHDQTENAFSYARAGAAVVLEQRNLTPHLLIAEIDRLMNDQALREKMAAAARAFYRPDAARKIGAILLETVVAHEAV